MYIEVKNPGRETREKLMEEFATDLAEYEYQNADFHLGEIPEDEEKADQDNRIFKFFNFIKEEAPDTYFQLIGLIYADYYLMTYSYAQSGDLEKAADIDELMGIDNIYDVMELIDQNPDYIMTLLAESFEYCLAEPNEKRDYLKNSNQIDRYLHIFNPFHVLEKIEVCRDFVCEDIIIKQKELRKEYNDQLLPQNRFVAEIFRQNQENEEVANYEVSLFLTNIYFLDQNNYCKLIVAIAHDAYRYQMFQQLNNKDYDASLLECLEVMNLDDFINATLEDRTILCQLITPFIEFHKYSLDQKNHIINTIIKKEKSGKIKKILVK